jgi:hypothetical protein
MGSERGPMAARWQMKLSSNRDLFEYLTYLARKLNEAGAAQLADSVLAASRTASGIPITEFLGESRIALRHVQQMGVGLLTRREQADLADVLAQIDAAFDNR